MVYLIRHGKTAGNLEGRYVGRTDEPLCEAGREQLARERYPHAEQVFTSPMLRCRETAQLLYPETPCTVIEEWRECDFGRFEYHTYEELSKDPDYQGWIDSGGKLPFPEGESREAFIQRSLQGFRQMLAVCAAKKISRAALIVHGGTIMSILQEYAIPGGDYYDFQVRNGEGYALTIMDHPAAGGRISAGSPCGGSEMALSSGTVDRSSDHSDRANYQKLFSEE